MPAGMPAGLPGAAACSPAGLMSAPLTAGVMFSAVEAADRAVFKSVPNCFAAAE